MEKVLPKFRKYRGRTKNFLLRAISPFPTVFSKDSYCRHYKAPYEQFLLFPRCFQKTYTADM